MLLMTPWSLVLLLEKKRLLFNYQKQIIQFGLTDKKETTHCGVEQLVARQAHNLEVVINGSNPTPATKCQYMSV